MDLLTEAFIWMPTIIYALAALMVAAYIADRPWFVRWCEKLDRRS